MNSNLDSNVGTFLLQCAIDFTKNKVYNKCIKTYIIEYKANIQEKVNKVVSETFHWTTNLYAEKQSTLWDKDRIRIKNPEFLKI